MKLKWFWHKDTEKDFKWHNEPPASVFNVSHNRIKSFNNYYAVEHIPLKVYDDDDVTVCSLLIAGHYQFCCGLREIGHIDVDGVEDMGALVSFLHDNLCKGTYNFIGALTYTEVKDSLGYFTRGEEVNTFLNAWPNGSAGPWWFNPNSGNHVRIWTLPINQHLLQDEDVPEEEDDNLWDERDE